MNTQRFRFFTLAAVLLTAAPAALLAQNAVRTNAGFRAAQLPSNDDQSSPAVAIGFPINLFNRNYTQLYVNNNGNLTFNGPLSDFTPDPISLLNQPIVAAYWGDVDTRSGLGTVYYGRDTVNGRPAFAATYESVGYFSLGGDKRNTFQIVLIDQGSGNFDVELNYNQIQWDRTDTSVTAEAGYTNGLSGSNRRFYRLNGSGQSGAFLDSNPNGLRNTSLNSTVRGRHVLFSRDGQIVEVPPLTLTRIDPNSGSGPNSLALTATGTGFANGCVVIWRRSGVETQLTATVDSATQLRTTIPGNFLLTPGTADVLVQCTTGDAGPRRSNSLPFTIGEELTLTSVQPDRVPVRPATGEAVDVQLTGTGFGPLAQAIFQGRQLEIVSRGGTFQLAARIPAELLTAPLQTTILVRNPATSETPQRDSNTRPFSVFLELRLDSVDPPSVTAGSPATAITVSGAGFTDGTRIRLVGPNGSVTPSTQSVNVAQQRISVTLGADLLALPANYQLEAVQGSTVSQNRLPFAVTQGNLSISTLTPNSAPAGSGQFELTIEGTGFTSAAQVRFGTATLTPLSGLTANRLRVNATAPTAPGPVSVTVRIGSVESNALTFTATSTAPVIEGLSPVSVPAGSPEFELTINGRNLVPNPQVRIGNTTLVQSVAATSTQIRARVPANLLQQQGTLTVTVTVNGQSVSTNLGVTAPLAPTIVQLSPNSRVAGTGDFTLTISGRNLAPSPIVRWAGQILTIVGTPSGTSITVTVPAVRIAAPGTFGVTVQVGTQTSAASNFTVTAGPVPSPILTLSSQNVPSGGNATAVVRLASATTQTVTGRLELTFSPNAIAYAGMMDPALVFVANSQRTLDFTIPAGQMQAQLPSEGRVNVGTVAGTISVRIASLTAPGAASPTLPAPQTITVPRTRPVLTAGTAKIVNNQSGGFNVEVEGYAPSREITGATFSFSIAPGTEVLGTTTFPVDVRPRFTQWYANPGSRAHGSRFRLEVPFSIAEGDLSRITGVTVTLTNADGSDTATGGR